MNQNIVFSNPFIVLFFAGTLLTAIINQALEFIDLRARQKNEGKLPEILREIPESSVFDTVKLKKISEYENAKYYLWVPKALINVILTLALVFSGFYPWLFNFVTRFTGVPSGFSNTFVFGFLFLILSGLPAEIVNLPFDLFREFKIEKKFGFSKMTARLFIIDSIKNIVISIIFSAILVLAISAVITIFPKSWWIFITCILFAFSLIMMIIYPLFIAPLFNKFTPLEDGELKTKIQELLLKMNFTSQGIFVMDASKRSGHSNAYFTGFGKSKRIVLYDTLIKQLSVDELVAVLGHELGHFKLKHILKRFIKLVPAEFLLMFVIFKLSQSILLYTGFGFAVSAENVQSMQLVGFFLASLIWEAISEILSPFTNAGSRKDEYSADRFSKELTNNPDALISALIKLNSENLSELLPPKLYVLWNYSHPTLIERITALKKEN